MSECLTYIHVLIKTNTSRVEDGELRSISEIKKFNPHSECEYIVIVGGPDGHENLLQENVRIFTSDFVFNSVVNCHMDFDKNSLWSSYEMKKELCKKKIFPYFCLKFNKSV